MGYGVKGAGDSESGNNPKVTSKFDRMHGHSRTPGSVSRPGGVAPVTGTHVAGHNEHGHKLPVPAKGPGVSDSVSTSATVHASSVSNPYQNKVRQSTAPAGTLNRQKQKSTT